MKNSIVLFFIISQLVFCSCKHAEKATLNKGDSGKIETSEKINIDTTISSVNLSEIVNENKKQNEIKSDTMKYDLVVSFYSIGSGIDRTILKEYINFLNENKENYSNSFSYERVPWGREGEVDFCIQLFNLKEKEIETFKNNSNTILRKSSMVHSTENAICNKRRR